MAENDVLNEMMGFNPQDLNVFQKTQTSYENPNIYKTNPNNPSNASEDGHYHSRVKVLANPFNIKNSIVKTVRYALKDAEGFFMVDSKLVFNDTSCPIFQAWRKLWRTNDKDAQDFAKKMFKKNESQWVLVQVIEDETQPEAVGQFKVMKLAKDVFTKLQAKMNPSADSKKAPVNLLDYVFGPALEIDVTPGPDDPKAPERKSREISYTLCNFEDDPTPVIMTSGENLFTDDELELIDAYDTAKKAVAKAKTAKSKAEKEAELAKMVDDVKKLYAKAIAYVKENALNLEEEVGYKEWTPEEATRVNNWLSLVSQQIDPSTMGAPVNEAPAGEPTMDLPKDDMMSEMMDIEETAAADDDMPF